MLSNNFCKFLPPSPIVDPFIFNIEVLSSQIPRLLAPKIVTSFMDTLTLVASSLAFVCSAMKFTHAQDLCNCSEQFE
jgi:hypothetical protein